MSSYQLGPLESSIYRKGASPPPIAACSSRVGVTDPILSSDELVFAILSLLERLLCKVIMKHREQERKACHYRNNFSSSCLGELVLLKLTKRFVIASLVLNRRASLKDEGHASRAPIKERRR